MSKKKDVSKQPLLPAAQNELNERLTLCQRSAYHAEALGIAELVMRGMKMQAIRAVAENSEALEKAGFSSLEAFFESLQMNPRTGFRLKKMMEAFSEEELTLCQSAGFSQRGILKLASLPADQLSELKDTDDPDELRLRLESALIDLEKTKKASADAETKHTVEIGKLSAEVETLRSQIPGSDTSWADNAIDRIEALFSEIDNRLSHMAFDPRIIGDEAIKARVDGFYARMRRRFIEFVHKWEEQYGCQVGDNEG